MGTVSILNEPVIVAFGRRHIARYAEQNLRNSLVRAFRDDQADFVTLDDNTRGQRFAAASTAWAIDKGLLYCDKTDSDDQCSVSSFRLTDEGKKVILDPALDSRDDKSLDPK